MFGTQRNHNKKKKKSSKVTSLATITRGKSSHLPRGRKKNEGCLLYVFYIDFDFFFLVFWFFFFWNVRGIFGGFFLGGYFFIGG